MTYDDLEGRYAGGVGSVFEILDEQGRNPDGAMMRQARDGRWIYVDEPHGYRRLSDDDVKRFHARGLVVPVYVVNSDSALDGWTIRQIAESLLG